MSFFLHQFFQWFWLSRCFQGNCGEAGHKITAELFFFRDQAGKRILESCLHQYDSQGRSYSKCGSGINITGVPHELVQIESWAHQKIYLIRICIFSNIPRQFIFTLKSENHWCDDLKIDSSLINLEIWGKYNKHLFKRFYLF